MPQLDGLRAFAVLAVLCSHWLPWSNRVGHIGLAGVYLFFVLSGYLITRILLRARDARETGQTSFSHTIKSFFGRRFLRIFPVYYLVVVASYLLWPHLFGGELLWNLLYMNNVLAVLQVNTTAINHFWSLAVEEQFYLLWPLVILLTPRKHLWKSILVVVLMGPMWRSLALSMGWKHIVFTYLPWSNFDCLGLGALLAVLEHQPTERMVRVRSALLRVGFLLGILLWTVLAVLSFFILKRWRVVGDGPIYDLVFLLYPVAVALVGIWLVARAGHGMNGVAGAVLSAAPIRYMGTISYGIYIYHFFVQGLVDLGSSMWLGRELETWPRFFCMLAMTLAVSALSWHLFEKPINTLKKYFPYKPPNTSTDPAG